MKIEKQHWPVLIFTALYILGFGGYYFSVGNFEFLWYVVVLLFFFGLILATIRYTRFPLYIIWGLSLWGLLHMAGGGIPVGDSVLYAYHIIHLWGEGEFFVLKFDQVVHFYGFAVATLVMHHILRPQLREGANKLVLYITLVAAGMGLGAVNEIVEFAAVVSLSETGVGGYGNTMIDIIANTLGAFTAILIIHLFLRNPRVAREEVKKL